MRTPKPVPKVGQTLYQLNIGNAARNCKQELNPVVVKKVGRKYFTCGVAGKEDFWDIKFHKENWREVTNYSPDYCLYESCQEWEQEKEAGDIYDHVMKFFYHKRGSYSMAIEDLRAIDAIIKKYMED